jgi:hypothetical protein
MCKICQYICVCHISVSDRRTQICRVQLSYVNISDMQMYWHILHMRKHLQSTYIYTTGPLGSPGSDVPISIYPVWLFENEYLISPEKLQQQVWDYIFWHSCYPNNVQYSARLDCGKLEYFWPAHTSCLWCSKCAKPHVPFIKAQPHSLPEMGPESLRAQKDVTHLWSPDLVPDGTRNFNILIMLKDS